MIILTLIITDVFTNINSPKVLIAIDNLTNIQTKIGAQCDQITNKLPSY